MKKPIPHSLAAGLLMAAVLSYTRTAPPYDVEKCDLHLYN